MLQEQRRQQLDNIVQQMVANQEVDSDIQAVVNDFKSKYSQEEKPKREQGLFERIGGKIGEFVGETTGVTGTGQAIGASLFGGRAAEKITQKALSSSDLVAEAKKLPSGDPRRKELLLQAQQVASGAGQ